MHVNIKAWNVPEKFCSKIAKDVRPSKSFLMFDVFTCFTNCFLQVLTVVFVSLRTSAVIFLALKNDSLAIKKFQISERLTNNRFKMLHL